MFKRRHQVYENWLKCLGKTLACSLLKLNLLEALLFRISSSPAELTTTLELTTCWRIKKRKNPGLKVNDFISRRRTVFWGELILSISQFCYKYSNLALWWWSSLERAKWRPRILNINTIINPSSSYFPYHPTLPQ